MSDNERSFVLTMENLESKIKDIIRELILSPEGAKELARLIESHSTKTR